MIDDNDDTIFFIILILAGMVCFGISYSFDKYASIQEKCERDCKGVFSEYPDWTCVQSCLVLKGAK